MQAIPIDCRPLWGKENRTRYPNGLPDGIPANVYTQDAASGAAALAEEAVDWVRQLLERSARD